MTLLAECSDLVDALTAVVIEETERLEAGESATDLGTLISSKVRLTEQLNHMLGKVRRMDQAVLASTDVAMRDNLAGLLARLKEVSDANGKLIGRKKALSDDLLAAVLTEVRRQSGATVTIYRETGDAAPTHRTAPVAVDAKL